MFNGLFSSLFGKSKENNLSPDEVNENNNQQQQFLEEFDENILCDTDDNVRVILLDDDKDWLFVEKKQATFADKKQEEEEDNKNLQVVPFKSIFAHLNAVRENDENCLLSANLPLLYPNTMDESWFLTPPSCFSSGSIQLETSPIENLLIEHPSMSVYHNIRRRSLAAPIDEIDDLVVLELSHDIDNDNVVFVNKGKRSKGKNKAKRPSAPPKSVALILVTKNQPGTQKTAENRSSAISRSFFDRNNKTTRNSYKKNLHTINQPSSRTMSRKN